MLPYPKHKKIKKILHISGRVQGGFPVLVSVNNMKPTTHLPWNFTFAFISPPAKRAEILWAGSESHFRTKPDPESGIFVSSSTI